MNSKAFTLIEILIVVAIVGVLSGIVVISMSDSQERARIARSQAFSDSLRSSMLTSLVSEWKLDENTGTTVTDSWGSSDGDLTGHTPEWKTGSECILGSCLDLDGTVSEYIDLGNFNIPTSQITVEFWMNTLNTSKTGTLLSYASTNSDNEFLIYNYLNFGIYIGGAYVNTGVSANDGKWHHIVVTWENINGNVYLYKDGSRVYSGTLRQGYSINHGTSASLIIGQEQDSVGGGFASSQAFLGRIDGLAIYNKNLSLSEIKENYQKGLSYIK